MDTNLGLADLSARGLPVSRDTRVLRFRRKGVHHLACAGVFLVGMGVQGQTIANGGFEANQFSVPPGYISDNAPISGWTTPDGTGAGLNPAGGESGFANNGVIPEGNQVAFIASFGGSLSTTLSGLTAGQRYRVQLRANSDWYEGQTLSPILRATVDDVDVLTMNVYAVGGTAPYATLGFEFDATGTSHNLTLINDATDGSNLLIDDVRIAPSSNRWTIAPWTSDGDSGVQPEFVYTHAYNFGSTAGANINGVPFTGVGGGNPTVEGRFTTTYLGSVLTGDANTITGNGGILARDFLYGGNLVPAGSYQSINLEGLTPGEEYVVSIYSVGWEAPAPSQRWVTASVDNMDHLTLNQDLYDNDNGIVISYRYTASATGTASIRIAPVNPNNVSMHIYGFSNREAVSRNVAPAITEQPAHQIVAQELPVSFRVLASGFPTPTYRWQFNGADLPGATGATYDIPAAGPQHAGLYQVIVSNSLGVVTSAPPARLTVGIPMVNPSFEADAFEFWPGYSGDNPGGAGTEPGANGPITGWIQSNEAGSGINPIANGASPFANNGVIPNGGRVAFIQADSTLEQVLSGLSVGGDYYVHYYENARGGNIPALELRVDGSVLVPAHTIGSGGYRGVYSEMFRATAAEAALTFEKTNPLGGDTTVLIDNVAVVQVPAGTAPWLTREPEAQVASPGSTVTFAGQAIGSLPLGYQWLKDGVPLTGATTAVLTLAGVQASDEGHYSLVISNSVSSVTTVTAQLTVALPGIYGTGVAPDGTLLEDGAVDPHYRMVTSPDEFAPGPEAIVINSVWPIQAGVWLPNGPSSKWIGPTADQATGNAEGEYVYETTFNLTGVDVSRVRLVGGWATDNNGLDILVNGQSTGLTVAGFTALTPFTIATGLVEGANTLRFRMSNLPATPNPTGLRVDLKAILDTATTAPTLQITEASGSVTIAWSPASAGQKLQSAANVTGPWNEVVGATSPYTTPVTGQQLFYRVGP